MNLIKTVPLRKEVIWNCNEHGRNVNWNGMLCDNEEAGFQLVNMVPWFLTKRLSNDSKYPHLFKHIILIAQPLIKQLNCHPWFQPCLFRNLSLTLYFHD